MITLMDWYPAIFQLKQGTNWHEENLAAGMDNNITHSLFCVLFRTYKHIL
jgi:hypothetical protein